MVEDGVNMTFESKVNVKKYAKSVCTAVNANYPDICDWGWQYLAHWLPMVCKWNQKVRTQVLMWPLRLRFTLCLKYFCMAFLWILLCFVCFTFVFIILLCLFLAAFWSPTGKELSSWPLVCDVSFVIPPVRSIKGVYSFCLFCNYGCLFVCLSVCL